LSHDVAQVLNGLSFGAVLYLIAVGLTLIMGIMRVVNLMHGSGYLLGAYVALKVIQHTGSFALGVILALVGAVIVGTVVFLLLQGVGTDLTRQAVLTFGVVYVISDISLQVFGGTAQQVPLPGALQNAVHIGSLEYPLFRLVLIGLAALVALAALLLERRTLYGAVIRATADDPDMVSAIGRNPRWIGAATFIVGMCLAFLGGAFGGAVFGAYPGADIQFLVFALVVVVLGGMGSLGGSLIAALLVGVVDTVAKIAVPSLGDMSVFALMIIVLAFRPHGLFGRAA
jgi:branched-chain amino acid transport system permease protein